MCERSLGAVDTYATHKQPVVAPWLGKNPRITPHVTPTSGSWLNMVEIFLGIIRVESGMKEAEMSSVLMPATAGRQGYPRTPAPARTIKSPAAR